LFNRTKTAIQKGKQVKEAVQGAPVAARDAAAAAARAGGKRLVNGRAHCKAGGGPRGQHEPPYPPDKSDTWTDPANGQRYQLLICRHCEGVMKAVKIGSRK